MQAGQQQLTALFTFVARDPLTLKSTAITAVQPESEAVSPCSAHAVQGGAVPASSVANLHTAAGVPRPASCAVVPAACDPRPSWTGSLCA